jgi:hypothetical protein
MCFVNADHGGVAQFNETYFAFISGSGLVGIIQQF